MLVGGDSSPRANFKDRTGEKGGWVMDMERKNQTHATLRQSYLGSAGRPFTSAISASQSNVGGG